VRGAPALKNLRPRNSGVHQAMFYRVESVVFEDSTVTLLFMTIQFAQEEEQNFRFTA
jgi:hypothetical protein